MILFYCLHVRTALGTLNFVSVLIPNIRCLKQMTAFVAMLATLFLLLKTRSFATSAKGASRRAWLSCLRKTAGT